MLTSIIAILLALAPSIFGENQSLVAPVPSVYFTTRDSGVSAVSLETNQVDKIFHSDEELFGITYDSINNKLYWSGQYQIYQSNMNGSEVGPVFDTSEHGIIQDLDFDWISGKIYVATLNGRILACGTGTTGALNCQVILDHLSPPAGIAVDPTEGFIYWVTYLSEAPIARAKMDGSDIVTLPPFLQTPRGLAIDFTSRRLYWTEFMGDKIKSSDLNGEDTKLVVQLSSKSFPFGITISSDYIYWASNGVPRALQSATKDGQHVRTLYTGSSSINHMVIVPASYPDGHSSAAVSCSLFILILTSLMMIVLH